MARIRKRGSSWTVEIRRKGHEGEYASFGTKAEAAAWVLQREAELTGKRLPDHTLKDALKRYGRDRLPPTPAAQVWQATKLRHLATYPLAARPLQAITRTHLADWRDARLQEPNRQGGTISPATVNRELNLLAAVFRECAGDWGWLRINPMTRLPRPDDPPPRRRRITDAEAQAVVQALGYDGGAPETPAHRVALSFLFALETGMRGGEIVRIRPPHVRPKAVHVPHSKNGDARDVPLSPRAAEILRLVGSDFGLTDRERDYVFRAARDRAELGDIHYHDSRAEAIWRLSRKFNVLELAKVIGHRDPKSLMLYYATTADELADRLV